MTRSPGKSGRILFVTGRSVAALALVVHTLLINAFIHRFWELKEPFRSLTIGLFSKNVTIAAALLLYAGVSRLHKQQDGLS